MKSVRNFVIFFLAFNFFLNLPFARPAIVSDLLALKGKVVDLESGKAIPNAVIKINHQQQTYFTDENGEFEIQNLKPGFYLISCLTLNYPRYVLKIEVSDDKNNIVHILLPRSDSAQEIFELGGIKVEAEKELLPKDFYAITRISGAEIENLQATNLGDVLEMIPGLEKTNRLGLDKPIHANVRGAANDLMGSFGTKIVVDDAVFSNNANMQMSAEGTSILSSSGQGYDLRLIPADNIRSIEIIRGVPSARYGDLVSGVIKVETYTEKISPRIKFKANENTREFNFLTGLELGKWICNLNFNYGFSERSLRKEGDEFHRISSNLAFSRDFLQGKLPLNWKIFFVKLIDEEKPTDIYLHSAYNRGYSVHSNWRGEYQSNSSMRIFSNFFVHYTRQNSYKSRLVISEIGEYMAEMRMIGDEVNAGGRIEFNNDASIWNQYHQLSLGGEFQYDNNFGRGLIIDPEKPYYGLNSPQRPYSFNEVPGLSQVAFYLEDKISGKFLFRFSLNLGVRYDLFNPRSLNWRGLLGKDNFIQCRHGSFLSPRIGLLLNLSRNLNFRCGYGLSAKVPSMSYIFKPPQTYLYNGEEISYNQSNFDLKGYSVKEFKIGLDKKFANLAALSIEFYKFWRSDEISAQFYPFFYEINPDTTLVPTYSRFENIGWSQQYGTEISFKTKSFRGISFSTVATYRFTRAGYNALRYDENPAAIDSDGDGIADIINPPWQDVKDKWRKKLILDYKLEYLSKELGLWFQLIAQQIPFYEHKSNNPYERGIWANYLYKYPNKWVLNFRLSKSLWHDSHISIYVNNFLDDRGVYEAPWMRNYDPTTDSWGEKKYFARNNPLFWGIEFSTAVDFR